MQRYLDVTRTHLSSLLTGFDGKKCERLSSISFTESDAYARLTSLQPQAPVNVTIVMATTSSDGIILYQGFDQHVALEVFRGRIRSVWLCHVVSSECYLYSAVS